MLCPNGANLLVGREFASVGLRNGFVKGGCLLGSQFDRRLIDPDELQKHQREGILRFGGQAAHRLNGFFKQYCHAEIVAGSGRFRKPSGLRAHIELVRDEYELYAVSV
jgi:hypothetical protein